MPIPAQGFTITWGGASLSEVSSISIDRTRGLPVSRTGGFTSDLGTVRLQSFAANQIPGGDYGLKRRLVIQGGTATLINQDCVFENVTADCVVNDAVRFAYTFKVMTTAVT